GLRVGHRGGGAGGRGRRAGLIPFRPPMRWTSVLIYAAALLLVAATVGRLFGWNSALEGWLLLAWTVSLRPVAGALFRHPMRTPAWGLFIGFWGSLAVLTLIVFQVLGVFGVITGSTLTYAE